MELEESKIEQIKGVFDTLKDYCTHRFECHGCPFEKKYEDGGGICKHLAKCWKERIARDGGRYCQQYEEIDSEEKK